jgi:hypothetical protein
MDFEDIVRKCHQKRGRIRDPRSGIRKKFIPDPGGKKAPDPDPQHWVRPSFFIINSPFYIFKHLKG